MRHCIEAVAARPRAKVANLAAVVVASGLLAACASSSGGGSGIADRLFGGRAAKDGVTTAENADYDPDYFLKRGYCPPVEIRPGTEALVTYQGDHENDADFVKYQGSITRTARECTLVGTDTMTIKIGVAGRIVAGPKGGETTAVLPLRIAVVKQHGGTVLYTQEFKVSATIAPPQYGGDFSEVFDQVTFPITPDDRDLIVFVGFDQGKPPGATRG